MKTAPPTSSKRPGWLAAGLVLAAVAVISGGLIAWFSNAPPQAGPPPEAVVETPIPVNDAPTPEHPLIEFPFEGGLVSESPESPAGPGPDNPGTRWEKELEEIVQGDSEAGGKAVRLAALMRTAPEAGRAEVFHYLAGCASNQQYGLVREILTNSQTPESVCRGAWNDLLNRPDSIRLPALLEIAANDQHPMRQQARDMLSFVLANVDATNAGQWRDLVEARLKENPEP